MNEVAPNQIIVARRLTILAVVVWFAAAFVAGALGLVNQGGRPPVALAAFYVVPILGFLAAYGASASFRAFARTIPLTLLVGSHLWRFVGLGFVLAWIAGDLPAGFGIPEGFGDVISASGALVLLPMIRKGTASRGWLLAWNTFGVMDLVSAITMGVLYSEGPVGLLSTPASNTARMVTFPVSLIPTFFVPLFMLVHALIFEAGRRPRLESRSAGVQSNGGLKRHFGRFPMLFLVELDYLRPARFQGREEARTFIEQVVLPTIARAEQLAAERSFSRRSRSRKPTGSSRACLSGAWPRPG